MNAAIPPVLAPYIQQCIERRSLTLLTSVLDTPTNWLLIRFLIYALRGSDTNATASRLSTTNGNAGRHKVVFVSIWRSFDAWSEITRKCGLNLTETITSGQVCYIDGLNTSASATGDSAQRPVDLKGLNLKELNVAISAALRRLHPVDSFEKTVMVIDGFDLLLACQPTSASSEFQQYLLDIQSRFQSVVITCAADSALLHNVDASATPLETEHAALTRTLAHQSHLVFQLRPLETGQSKEVSGSVRISKGGAWENTETASDADEGEWLYHWKNDGTVKVWGRGEA